MGYPPIDVDTQSYENASDTFYDVNSNAADAVIKAATGADGAGGMAGCDSSGVEWAAAYDSAAKQALDAGTTLVDTLGHLGDLLSATGANHANADTSSTSGAPSYPGSGGGKGACSVSLATPPSADGSPGDEPDGWGLVAHLMSWVWPNGHQDQLRQVGSAWTAAGDDLTSASYDIYTAVSVIEEQQSPEVAPASKACTDAQQAMQDLGDAYAGLGQACNDYAQHLDDAHHDVIEELESLVEWTVGIEAGGAVLAFFTAGISEAAAQAAEAARCAAAATRIGTILSRLAELARTVITAIKGFATTIGEIVARLGKFAKGAVDAAVNQVGRLLTKGMSKDAAESAFQGLNKGGGHALRHLVDEGLLANKGSPAAKLAAFKNLTQPILEAPLKRFGWRVGATPCEGYAGVVDGRNVVVFVARSGPYKGKVLTSVVPDAGQVAQWGL